MSASTHRLIASTRLIAALTMASRVLGLVREGVVGAYFGTSALASAFSIAFTVPNLARRLFGEGALSSALIPVLTETAQRDGDEPARRLVGTVLLLLGVGLAGAVLVLEGVVLAWRSAAPDPALSLTAFTLPYMPVICVVAVAGGVLNTRGHFATPAAVPVLLNVVLIGAALGGALTLGWRDEQLMLAICVALLVGGLMQLAVTLGALRWVGFWPAWNLDWRQPQVRAILALMLPAMVGLSAMQLNTLLDRLIAYWFVLVGGERVGAAVLGYAHVLYQVPLGVFGIALATAIFPTLSARAAAGDFAGLRRTLVQGLRLGLFIALPAGLGLILTAEPLVATLLERGKFDALATQRVAATLACYSLGMPAYFAMPVIVRTFYALQDSRTPARTALATVALNLTLNLLLVQVLQERGLALSTALCAYLQAGYLLRRLRGRLGPGPAESAGLTPAVLRMALAAAVMAGVVVGLDAWSWGGGLASVPVGLRLLVLVVGGGLAYGGAAWRLGLAELKQLLRTNRRR